MSSSLGLKQGLKGCYPSNGESSGKKHGKYNEKTRGNQMELGSIERSIGIV